MKPQQFIVKVLNLYKLKIMNLVNFIAGKRGVEYVEKYKDTHFKLTVNLEQKLRENLKKAFWSKLQEDLFQTPLVMTKYMVYLKIFICCICL